MKTIERTDILSPGRFTTAIKQVPEFLDSLPKENFSELEPEQRRERLQRAIASGALAISNQLEQDHGAYDLDANLYRLVGVLDSFCKSAPIVDQLGKQYGQPKNMPPEEKLIYKDSKANITEFNHVLREVINAGASKFSFDELISFMTTMRAASGDRENMEVFEAQVRRRVMGMRNEMAVEQVLIAGGIDYELGTPEQDAIGGDFIIEGVPIDVKSSQAAAERARESARRGRYDDSRIIWSHINFKDYNGRLTLPYELNSRVLAELKPDLDKALHPDARG